MKNLIALLLTLTATVAWAQPKAQQRNETQAAGPIAGGGGFICTTSERVLDNAKFQLSNQIRKAPSLVFSTLPKEWTRERIIEIVEKVRLEDEKPAAYRHGKKLRFNYGKDQTGDYIEALEPFCYTYEGTPIDSADQDKLNPIYRQIHIEIMHEIGHILGIGQTKETDSQARQFAIEFIGKILNSFLLCEFNSLTEEQKQQAVPQVPSSMISKKMVIANVLGKRLEFNEMPLAENVRIERLQNDPDRLLNNGVYSWFATKVRKKQYSDLTASSTAQFIQQFPVGNMMSIEVWGDLQDTQPYSAHLKLESLGHKWISSPGACMIIAQPIAFDFVNAGGAK